MIDIESPNFGEENQDSSKEKDNTKEIHLETEEQRLLREEREIKEVAEREEDVKQAEALFGEEDFDSYLNEDASQDNEDNEGLNGKTELPSYAELIKEELSENEELVEADSAALEVAISEQEILVQEIIESTFPELDEFPEQKRFIENHIHRLIHSFKTEEDPTGFLTFSEKWEEAKKNGKTSEFLQSVLSDVQVPAEEDQEAAELVGKLRDLTPEEKEKMSKVLGEMFDEKNSDKRARISKIITGTYTIYKVSKLEEEGKVAQGTTESLRKDWDEKIAQGEVDAAYESVSEKIEKLAEDNDALKEVSNNMKKTEVLLGFSSALPKETQEKKEPTTRGGGEFEVGFNAVFTTLPAKTQAAISDILEANPNADILFNNMSGLQATEEGIEGHISNVKISLNATTGNFYLEGEESFTRGNYHHDARYSLPTPSPAGFKAALAHMIPDQGRIQSVAEDREIALAFYRATAGNPSDNSLPTVEDINAFRNIMLIFFNVPSKDGQPDKGAEIARLKETGLMRAESNVINPQRLNRLVTDVRRYFDIYRAYDELPPDFKYEHLLTIALLRQVDFNWRSVSYEELNNLTQTVVAVREIESDWRPATVLELEQLAKKRVSNGLLTAQDLVEVHANNNNHQS